MHNEWKEKSAYEDAADFFLPHFFSLRASQSTGTYYCYSLSCDSFERRNVKNRIFVETLRLVDLRVGGVMLFCLPSFCYEKPKKNTFFKSRLKTLKYLSKFVNYVSK